MLVFKGILEGTIEALSDSEIITLLSVVKVLFFPSRIFDHILNYKIVIEKDAHSRSMLVARYFAQLLFPLSVARSLVGKGLAQSNILKNNFIVFI